MSHAATIKAVLEADAGNLLLTATGGVWDFDETGRLGLSRTGTPAAFDDNERIKPSIVVKSRGEQPDGQIADDPAQTLSTQTVVELYFYQDSGYDDIETMVARCFALLHGKQASGIVKIYWRNHIAQQRDEDLDANVERSDYQVTALKTV